MYNDKQQQAVILKGIAHQLLDMNMPSVNELNILLRVFNLVSANKIIVLTNSGMDDSFTRLPFIEPHTRVSLYQKEFSSKKPAIMYCKAAAIEFKNRVKLPVDFNSHYADFYVYGKGSITYCSECNGRWWAVIENPSWM